jgi:DNA gyrase/topoisomerase IV subunit B
MVLDYDVPESDVLYNVFKRINEDFKSELLSNGVSEQSFIDSELEIVMHTNQDSLDWDDYYFEGKILVQGSRPFEEDEELNPEGTYKITSNQVMQIAENVIRRYNKFVNLLEVTEWIDE